MIAAQLATLPGGPGVYRMLNRKGDVLYVGKAKSLKKRVAAYTQIDRLSNRAEAHGRRRRRRSSSSPPQSEVEALLLESNLIKRLKPRYNVSLRDDKSFPIHPHHRRPSVPADPEASRRPRSREANIFGPFASAGAVNRTLTALQRAFLLRSCSDASIASRTRPCLLYQIKRCCGALRRPDRRARTMRALVGGGARVPRRQEPRGPGAAGRGDAGGERSAGVRGARRALRDRIRALRQIQAHQGDQLAGLDEADVIAAHQAGGTPASRCSSSAPGSNWGNRAYFPRHAEELRAEQILARLHRPVLRQQAAAEADPAEPTGRPSASCCGGARDCKAGTRSRSARAAARRESASSSSTRCCNAREALARRLGGKRRQRRLLEGVAEAFGLEAPPERIEVYDNSHISGTQRGGRDDRRRAGRLQKGAYRKFNITIDASSQPGDDYAMMREVLTRRFSRAAQGGPGARRAGPGPISC